MIHQIRCSVANLHGCFCRDRPAVLTIDSGDSISTSIPDAVWGMKPFARDVFHKVIKREDRRDPEHDVGHCMFGPVAVRGAKPGQTLAIEVRKLVPEDEGWTWAGKLSDFGPAVGIHADLHMPWRIDPTAKIATNPSGHRVSIAPFLGVMGVAPSEPSVHDTRPPRPCGGNIDCRELVAGSTLFLPIQTEGALFSFGDGHAAQGDGEISGTAIECGMREVELHLSLDDDLPLRWPAARTPVGWLAFGFDRDLRAATVIAINGMLDRMQAVLKIPRPEAYALASAVVDLRITQIANDVLGVHAVWAGEMESR